MNREKAVEPEVEERVDVDALMEEVRLRVAARREAGEYGPEMAEPAFGELAIYDELAASANRVAAAAHLADVVPDLHPVPPGGAAGPEGPDIDDVPGATGGGGVVDMAVGLAKRVARKAIGTKIDQFMLQVEDFFTASSANAREVAERVIALERRVAELESEREESGRD